MVREILKLFANHVFVRTSETMDKGRLPSQDRQTQWTVKHFLAEIFLLSRCCVVVPAIAHSGRHCLLGRWAPESDASRLLACWVYLTANQPMREMRIAEDQANGLPRLHELSGKP